MAIYLDSNVLFPWRTFAELDRVALSIVASQTNQLVLIPWLVEEEVVAHYQRSLEEALNGLDSALNDVNRLFDAADEVWIEPHPSVDAEMSSYRTRLAALATTISINPEDAV